MLVPESNGYKYLPLALSRRTEAEKENTELRMQASDQTAAELDDELYSLASRIFKREITTVISHISHVVLLPKD